MLLLIYRVRVLKLTHTDFDCFGARFFVWRNGFPRPSVSRNSLLGMQTCPDVSSDLASLACHSTIGTVAGTTTYLSRRDSRALVMVLAAPSAGQWKRNLLKKVRLRCLAYCLPAALAATMHVSNWGALCWPYCAYIPTLWWSWLRCVLASHLCAVA